MQDFRVSKIREGVYSILDAGDSSFYVVEGKERVAVIDTGVTFGGKIMPLIRTLTDKPLVLILTHAHFDHMYHADEFDTVYMCHEELNLSSDILYGSMNGKKIKLNETIPMDTGSVIDLGDHLLEICRVGGHTPGSVVVYDSINELLFTGDAIGSGYGVWMQVPGALTLREYLDNLIFLLKWLVKRGGRMQFWGGHSYQQFQSTLIVGYNPIGMGLLCDLIDLVDGLVKGTIVGRSSNADKVLSFDKVLYASYGRAEIQYCPDKMK